MLRLHKSLVRPHLEHCSPVGLWSHTLHKGEAPLRESPTLFHKTLWKFEGLGIQRKISEIKSVDTSCFTEVHIQISVTHRQGRSQDFSLGAQVERRRRDTRIEAPKAPRGVGCGEGVKIFEFLYKNGEFWCILGNSYRLAACFTRIIIIIIILLFI